MTIQPDTEVPWSAWLDPDSSDAPLYCASCEDAKWCSFGCTQKGARRIQPVGADHTIILHHGSYDTHRQLCCADKAPRPLAGFDVADQRQALFFPMDHETPELVSVHYDPRRGSLVADNSPFRRFDALEHGGAMVSAPSCRLLDKDELKPNGWDVVHGFVLVSYLQSGPTPACLVNKSIAALGKPQQLKTWRGPVLVLAVSPNPEGKHCLVENLSYRDVSLAIHYFRSHSDNIGFPGTEFDEELFLTNTKMTDPCNSFIASAFGKLPPVVPIRTPIDRRYSGDWKPCAMAHRLGLPWYVTTANCPSWDYSGDDHAENKDARWLKYVFEQEEDADTWLSRVRDERRITVPVLREYPTHGSILIKPDLANYINPIEPFHIDMFNKYLDLASGPGGHSPTQEGFSAFGRQYMAALKGSFFDDMPEFRYDRLPLFRSPARPADPRDMPLERLDVTKLDDEIFWLALLDHRARAGGAAPRHPRDEAMEDLLALAATVISAKCRVDDGPAAPTIQYGDGDMAMFAETPLGRLYIQRDDTGRGPHYFRMVPYIKTEAMSPAPTDFPRLIKR